MLRSSLLLLPLALALGCASSSAHEQAQTLDSLHLELMDITENLGVLAETDSDLVEVHRRMLAATELAGIIQERALALALSLDQVTQNRGWIDETPLSDTASFLVDVHHYLDWLSRGPEQRSPWNPYGPEVSDSVPPRPVATPQNPDVQAVEDRANTAFDDDIPQTPPHEEDD